MTISVRLDVQVERRLTQLSERLGMSKSEIIKRSLDAYLEMHATETPYALGADLFGRVGSGKGDLSERRRTYLKEKLRAKNAR
jgi:predicted DNA-binding protein